MHGHILFPVQRHLHLLYRRLTHPASRLTFAFSAVSRSMFMFGGFMRSKVVDEIGKQELLKTGTKIDESISPACIGYERERKDGKTNLNTRRG